MEQQFQQNFFAFFLEFKQFSYYFAKTSTSLAKLCWEFACLCVFVGRSLCHLLFAGPSLYKWHTPTQKEMVVRNAQSHYPRMF